MSQLIQIKDKQFKPFISSEKINNEVLRIAKKINSDLVDDFPIFLVVLNGSFMFAADLLKEITIPCEISFIKLASYESTLSAGTVTELIGLKENVLGRNIVIIEDVVDSGNTVEKMIVSLKHKNAKAVSIAAVLFKSDAYTKNYPITYVGFEIKNDFVVGYGMDYCGLGRNLKDIYVLAH